MPPIHSDALVLRTFKLGETSKVAVLLTRERGKVRAVAKGARGPKSRYQSALETLSEVRVGLYGRQGAELYRMGGCELIRSAFPGQAAGLDSAFVLSYFAELIESFTLEDAAEDAVYRLAVAVLRAAEEGTDLAVLSRYLEAWLLKLHGLYPPVNRCVTCRQPLDGPLRYHRPARAFRCEACGPVSGPVLSLPVRDLLADIFRQPPVAMKSIRAAESGPLESFHQELIVNHLERDLRSYRVLKDVARGAQA
jgi:DNA repair protein RecO (recombination protein O)